MAYLEEVLPEFRNDAKIRRKCWGDNDFVEISDFKKGLIFTNKEMEASDWEFYQEPIDWDYIIKNKCLCYFWDEWFGAACIGILGEIYKGCDLKYVLRDKNGNQSQFRNCLPVSRDEVTFYEDKK